MVISYKSLLNASDVKDIIIPIVCEEFHVSYEQICNPTRKRDIILPRQVIMHSACYYSNVPLRVIGQFFEGSQYHYSTVIHGRDLIDDLMEYDRVFRERIKRIQSRIELAFKLNYEIHGFNINTATYKKNLDLLVKARKLNHLPITEAAKYLQI